MTALTPGYIPPPSGSITAAMLQAGAVRVPAFIAFLPAATLSGSTAYAAPGDVAFTGSQGDHQIASPAAVTAIGITYRQNAAVAAGKTLVVALQVNDADVGDVLTLLPADGTTAKSVVFAASAAIAKGDRINYRLTGDGIGSIPAGTECSVAALVAEP